MMNHPPRRALALVDHDYGAAVTMGIGLVVALTWSLLSWSTYSRAIDATWTWSPLHTLGVDSLHLLVVNALMTIFFFAIGLELSREVASGTFARTSHFLAPVLAALGGMVATAGLTLLAGAITRSSPLSRGWGVPMATDIAFTLGALALAGRGLPSRLRIFLLTLAVADDVFSVIVLAITGSSHPRWWGLASAAALVAVVVVVSRRRHDTTWRLIVLVALWLTFVAARVEPPLAGVLAALVVPSKPDSTLALENRARRWSTVAALPLFALVSCGLHWSRLSGRSSMVIVMAMVVVRLVGKVAGVTGGAYLARRLGAGVHPSLTGPVLAASSLLCAIGFTVPLLFAGALFSGAGAVYQSFVLGLLLASLLAGAIGVTALRRLARTH
jgi:Na+:H+ antiporter, NhaA family